GIVNREHGNAMADRRKALERLPADALRGAVGTDQLGMLRLQLHQAVHHPVELAVADLRPGLDIVEIVMPVQLAAQASDIGLDLLLPVRHDRVLPLPTQIARRRRKPSAHTRSSTFLDFDRRMNQGSVAMARIPARSMVANSMARARGPWRS